MRRFLSHFVHNGLLVNLVTIALLISGLMFMFSARKEAFPNVDFGWVIITTVYPGATPSDVEKLVTKPIEDELRGVSGIKEVSSGSRETLSIVACELDPDLNQNSKNKTIQSIKDAVGRVRDLPSDVEDPDVMEISMAEFPVIRFSILNKNGIQNDTDEFEARKYAKMLKDRLQSVKGAASVRTTGYRDREMMVEVSLAKLNELHVALNEVSQALTAKNVNFPGGTVMVENEDVLIRTVGEFESAGEIENVVIRANDTGQFVTVGDIAKVRDTFEEQNIINKTNGKRSITVALIIKEKADIVEVVKDAKAVIRNFSTLLPPEYEVVPTDDLSFYVNRRLEVLKGNAIVGLALVILSLFITLGWRMALVTAFGLPVAFAGTFWMMGVFDISINLISMFGLIMVLGMLVDDAIIVAENIYRHIAC